MNKREYFFSQIALLVIGVLTLLAILFFSINLVIFIAYIPTLSFLGETVAEWGIWYFCIIPVIVIVSLIVIPVLSLLFCKFGSDKLYRIFRKLCNVILTVFITIAVFLAYICVSWNVFSYARTWSENNADIPFLLLLFLVPVFFVFFSKIKLRIPDYVGNTSLVVLMFPIINLLSLFMYDDQPMIGILLISTIFVAVWFFEQVLRDNDGKAALFSRILLTAISSLGAFVISSLAVRLVSGVITDKFSHGRFNSLLLTVSVLSLFVAYIVKINRNSKNLRR